MEIVVGPGSGYHCSVRECAKFSRQAPPGLYVVAGKTLVSWRVQQGVIMLRYFQHGETGRVVATETELQGEWYEIEKDQYEEALHPLSPANKSLKSDVAEREAIEDMLANGELEEVARIGAE